MLLFVGGFFEELIGTKTEENLDGNWGSWLSWTTCTVTCGGGVRHRTRNCDNPPPGENGKGCGDNSTETGDCFTQNCPISKLH